METSGDPGRILEKGPGFLRRQMELESEHRGRMSAVQRLAASRPQYVKSRQAASCALEPPASLLCASAGSAGSSERWSSRRGRLATREPEGGSPPPPPSPGQERRCSGKKRPDSLLIYRQRCEQLRGPANNRKQPMARKLLLGASGSREVPVIRIRREKESDEDQDEDEERIEEPQGGDGVGESDSKDDGAQKPAGALLLQLPEPERRAGRGVSRSHSDISSRYSRNFSDFDVFFQFCGLDGEVVESLGRENFCARSDGELPAGARSVSASTSDGGFTGGSGGSDGLQEEELQERVGQGTSVIERNARIIKWLYSCRNAAETGKKLRDLD